MNKYGFEVLLKRYYTEDHVLHLNLSSSDPPEFQKIVEIWHFNWAMAARLIKRKNIKTNHDKIELVDE